MGAVRFRGTVLGLHLCPDPTWDLQGTASFNSIRRKEGVLRAEWVARAFLNRIDSLILQLLPIGIPVTGW